MFIPSRPYFFLHCTDDFSKCYKEIGIQAEGVAWPRWIGWHGFVMPCLCESFTAWSVLAICGETAAT